MSFRSDIDAVRALKEDSRAAFKYLFKKYYDRLVAYIVTYTHDKARSEDIVQQAFIGFWEDRFKLDEGNSPKGYLFAIAHNRYIDTLKNAKKQEKILNQIWERALRNRIQEDYDEVSEKRILRMEQAIEALPPKCKQIIKMNKVQGIKYREIAEYMGISIKTVESQMRIAFRKIRESFKEDLPVLFLLCKKISLNNINRL